MDYRHLQRVHELERKLEAARGKLEAVRAWRRPIKKMLAERGGALVAWSILDRILGESE